VTGIVTGEAVEVELPVARLATRTVAIFIDFLVQLGLFFVGFLLIGALIGGTDVALGAAVYILFAVGVFLVWPITFETVSRGRSLGKLAMGLRVVRDDGGPIRFRQALVRSLVGLAVEYPGILLAPLTWIFGMITMLFSARAKRLGDMAAGTIVLQERLPDRGRYALQVPPALAPWAQTLDLTRLDDGLALAMRQFLSRSAQLAPAAREVIGRRLALEVAAVTAPAPPPGVPGWAYLSSVLAERSRRESGRLAQRRAVVTSAGIGWDSHGTPSVHSGYFVDGRPIQAGQLRSAQVEENSAWVDPSVWAGQSGPITTSPAQPRAGATGFVQPG
jgi:uncharacterized RDD family membrane protein YckC